MPMKSTQNRPPDSACTMAGFIATIMAMAPVKATPRDM